MYCVGLSCSWWSLDQQEILLIHGSNAIKSFKLTLIEVVLVLADEVIHLVFDMLLTFLAFFSDSLQRLHWVQYDLACGIEFTALDSPELSDCRH